jgi:hypothetical protein
MTDASSDRARAAAIVRRVWHRAEAAGFRGPDPYDGLGSRLLAPLLPHSRLLRLAVIQGVKRSPIDLRPLLAVHDGINPKGLALFLHGIADWPAAADGAAATATATGDRLLSLASRADGTPYFGGRAPRPGLVDAVASGEAACSEAIGWGYDFRWQARAFMQPPYFPTVVATSFVVDALAAAGSPAFPRVAAAAARLVDEQLHRRDDADGVCFSYSPRDRTRVLNASLFAAKLLTRAAVTNAAGAADHAALARRAGDYAAARQRADGAWLYGEADHWRWIDGLHTGFVLETLAFMARELGVTAWDDVIRRGLAWYRDHLFRADGWARYHPDRDFPFDGHTVAQGALTFLALARYQADGAEQARRVLARGVAELWDERRGGFTTRAGRWRRDRTLYLRWSQAWMFRALCAWLAAEERRP